MKLKLLAIFFLVSSYLSSQQTVTTSGGDIESDQVSLSYTIGQLKVNTIEKVDSSILKLDFIQGVQYAIDVFDCSKMVVPLVKAVQELTVEIEKLKKELELLKQSKE